MNQTVANTFNESVHISVPLLVRLNQFAAGLSLRSTRILARQAGDYLSPFKGRGMEFDESRLYQPGDDTRNIDWRVTARTGKTYTKLFREEREQPVFIWADLRAPMFYATKGRYKSVIAAHLASLLSWSAIRQGDRIGGVIFSEHIHHELKPHRGKSGVLRLINQLVHHPAWQTGKLPGLDEDAGARALMRLRRVARPGSMIFLLSDFRNLDETAISQIVRLGRHNEIVMIFIYDQLESTLPSAGQYRVSDGNEEVLLDTFDKQRVAKYKQRFLQHKQHLQQLAHRNRLHFITCSTEDAPLVVLQAGLGA